MTCNRFVHAVPASAGIAVPVSAGMMASAGMMTSAGLTPSAATLHVPVYQFNYNK